MLLGPVWAANRREIVMELLARTCKAERMNLERLFARAFVAFGGTLWSAGGLGAHRRRSHYRLVLRDVGGLSALWRLDRGRGLGHHQRLGNGRLADHGCRTHRAHGDRRAAIPACVQDAENLHTRGDVGLRLRARPPEARLPRPVQSQK
jgi:hypothetical protein